MLHSPNGEKQSRDFTEAIVDVQLSFTILAAERLNWCKLNYTSLILVSL